MEHTATHCHCGKHREGSDHCPECGCEEFERVCDHVTPPRIWFEDGNWYMGDPAHVGPVAFIGPTMKGIFWP